MPTRRRLLSAAFVTAGLGWIGRPRTVFAAAAGDDIMPATAAGTAVAMATRPIPSSGERLPVIGMGTSGSFEVGTSDSVRAPLREVLARFFAGGGALIDTAPSYGTAEDVLGALLSEIQPRPRVFMATKLSSYGHDAGLRQFNDSLRRLQLDKVDLLQVHNLRDWKIQFALIEELKVARKVRYSGLTHYRESEQDELAEVARQVRPDFIQINYSVVSRGAEKRLFPLAQEQGMAVLINRAFEDGALFSRVRGQALPAWADEAGITSWAQAFLKFALSHPAVTAVIPATGKPDHQSDNLKAGAGPTLNEEQRRALIALFA